MPHRSPERPSVYQSKLTRAWWAMLLCARQNGFGAVIAQYRKVSLKDSVGLRLRRPVQERPQQIQHVTAIGFFGAYATGNQFDALADGRV